MTEDFLLVQNLSHGFSPDQNTLTDINFRLTQGETVLLAGQNGSGKTVLMKHLNGLLLPRQGTVFFRGRDTRKEGAWIRRRVGLVFQDADACLVGQTVWEDILFGAENLGMEKAAREAQAKELLQFLDLWKKRDMPPRFLSGGEKKKLTIGGLLIMDPELLILDEPFTGLDFPGVREILNLLLELKAKGTSLLIVSHDLEKVLALAERLLILNQGRLTADGHPGDLLDLLEENGIKRPAGADWKSMSWL